MTDGRRRPRPRLGRTRCSVQVVASPHRRAPLIGDSVSSRHDRDRRPQTITPLIDALHVRAIRAYEMGDPSALPGLHMLGPVMNLHGIGMNGGLVGGGIENLVLNGAMQAVDDAIEGFRWLGLADVAALVARACDEYLRFRPTATRTSPPRTRTSVTSSTRRSSRSLPMTDSRRRCLPACRRSRLSCGRPDSRRRPGHQSGAWRCALVTSRSSAT